MTDFSIRRATRAFCVSALHRASRFARARSGGVAILVGLAIIPMTGAVSIGVEFLRGVTYRSRLNAATDAAAIAAITAARDHLAANSKSTRDETATAKYVASMKAYSVFYANAGGTTNVAPVNLNVVVDRAGQKMTANVSYTSSYSTVFGKIFGIKNIAFAGRAEASLTMGSYTDFYLLLDTSGSMGFPTSAEQQKKFAAMNPDMNVNGKNNCAFACHFPGWEGFGIAKRNNIELRIETVGKAVQQLLATAKDSATLPDQFRVGLYPFVSAMEVAAEATTNLDSLVPIAGKLEDFMDVGNSDLARKSGGTHFNTAFAAIDGKITRRGDGSSATRAKPFVFVVTDGIANNQYWDNASGWTGSQSSNLNPADCKKLKDGGVIISILYTPYEPIAYNDDYYIQIENSRVNGMIPDIPKTLKDCGTPGYFQTARTAVDISNALDTMFKQATATARLTR